MEQWINKHSTVILMLGGVLSTAISLTVYAYREFATKNELKQEVFQVRELNADFKEYVKERFDRLENKIDNNTRGDN